MHKEIEGSFNWKLNLQESKMTKPD